MICADIIKDIRRIVGRKTPYSREEKDGIVRYIQEMGLHTSEEAQELVDGVCGFIEEAKGCK